MPDETPTPESDARDERVAELLAVEPLDEVTRRRLVRTALEESVPRSSRFANVAAIALAVLIGGGVGAVLVDGPDDNPPVATEAAAPTEAAPEVDDGEQGDALRPATSFAPVEALGDLGDVSTRAALREAVTGAFERGVGAAAAPGAAQRYPCVTTPPEQLGLVAVVAAGTATYQSLPVSVVVGTSPAGESLALVLAAPPGCEVLSSVELPRS